MSDTQQRAAPICQSASRRRINILADKVNDPNETFRLVLTEPLNAQLALITPESLSENLRLVPAVALGVFGGRWLIRHVSQRLFEWMIVAFSAIAGLRLMFW